jgi:hypothetical protein
MPTVINPIQAPLCSTICNTCNITATQPQIRKGTERNLGPDHCFCLVTYLRVVGKTLPSFRCRLLFRVHFPQSVASVRPDTPHWTCGWHCVRDFRFSGQSVFIFYWCFNKISFIKTRIVQFRRMFLVVPITHPKLLVNWGHNYKEVLFMSTYITKHDVFLLLYP